MNSFLKKVFPLIPLLLYVCMPSCGVSQQDATQEIGIVPFGSYHGGDIDRIDLKSGNLFAQIPLFSLPQLGNLKLSMSLTMNDSGYSVGAFCDTIQPTDSDPAGGEACYPYVYRFTNFGPALTFDQNMTFQEAGSGVQEGVGTVEELGLTGFDSTGSSHIFGQDASNYNLFHSVDGTGYTYLLQNDLVTGLLDGTLSDGDGNSYSIDLNGAMHSISDIHSNSINLNPLPNTFTYMFPFQTPQPHLIGESPTYPNWSNLSGVPSGVNTIQTFAQGLTDTLGRSIPGLSGIPYMSDASDISRYCPTLPSPSPAVTSLQRWTVPGPGGSATYTFCYANLTVNTNILNGWQYEMSADGNQDQPYYADYIASGNVIQSVVLPNGTYWGFVYDSTTPGFLPNGALDTDTTPTAYGDVTKILYPTGGSVSYCYSAQCAPAGVAPGMAVYACNDEPIAAPGYPSWAGRVVYQRTLNDGQSSPSTWSYSYAPIPDPPFGANGIVTTVTNPVPIDGLASSTIHTFTDQILGQCALPEVQTQTLEGSTVLQTVSNQFNTITNPSNVYQVFSSLPSISTTREGESTTTNTNSYSNLFTYTLFVTYGTTVSPFSSPQAIPFAQPTSVTLSGSDGTSKTSTTTYQWQNSSEFYTQNVLNAISEMCISATSNGCTAGGAQIASAARYLYGDSNSPYNLVTEQHLLNGNWLTTKGMAYDSYGRTLSMADANGNLTSDAYGTDPVTGAPSPFPNKNTNALHQNEYYSYDDDSGHLLWHTDANGSGPNDPAHTTSYSYDVEGRLTSILSPDGGLTNYCYTDVGGGICSQTSAPFSVYTSISASPDPTIVSHTNYDGLGRVTHSFGADGAETDTAYDALGRTASLSNPYYSINEATYGVTQYRYDALGRKVMQIQPGNSGTIQWCYDGLQTDGQANCSSNSSTVSAVGWVDITNESGIHSQQVSDALGNLKAVMNQDPVGTTLSLETDYGYDALGNLTSVAQNGVTGEAVRTRSFSYDSMSHLQTAINPETGSISYTYDGNGDLLTKTTGNGTVSYCYDALDRITGKSFTDQGCPLSAPDISYSYDSSFVSGATNTIGHLTTESVYSGGSLISQRQPYSYDAMGRVNQLLECTPVNCSGSPYHLAYKYDLAGNIIKSTNGVPSSDFTGNPDDLTPYYGTSNPSFNGAPTPTPTVLLTAGYDGAGRLGLLSSSWSDSMNHPNTLLQANSINPASYGPAGLQNAMLGYNSQSSQTLVNLVRTYDSRLRVTSEIDSGSGTVSLSATGSVGSITIAGTEQESGTSTSPATATIAVSGFEGEQQVCSPVKPPLIADGAPGCHTAYDVGHVSAKINGFTATAPYGQGSTTTTVSNALAAAFGSISNPVSGSPVTATVTNGVITLTSIATGTAANYSISTTSGDFTLTPSGANMTGGASGSPVYDTGNVSVMVNGSTFLAPWAAGSSAQTIANQLFPSIEQTESGSYSFTTSPDGLTLNMTSLSTGISTNSAIVCSAPDSASQSPSFSINCAGMSGGTDSYAGPQQLYSYMIPNSGGYAPNGNLLSVAESVMGNWTYGYDNLNRLITATASSGSYMGTNMAGATLGWTYDSFGNRLTQSSNSGLFPTGSTQFTDASNQASGVGLASSPTISTDTLQYDAAGNLIGKNSGLQYAYNAEGRLCAAQSNTGGYEIYIYDAEGNRVAKGSASALNCNMVANPVTFTNSYVVDSSGQQLTEFTNQAGQWGWAHSNVFTGGRLLETYADTHTYFALSDWLSSKRVVVAPDTTQMLLSSNASLPFGDGLSVIGNASDATEYHFTDKQRDSESENDYFLARYYVSNTARFTSPDYSDGPDAAAFSDLSDPQSLNLYSYVENNPINGVDDDGHDCASEATLQANGLATPSLGCRILNALKRLFGGSDADQPDPGPQSGPPPIQPSLPQGGFGTVTGPLIQAQNAARANPDFQPGSGATHCNQALRCIAGLVGGINMADLGSDCCYDGTANAIADRLPHSGNFHQVGRAEAQRIANTGKVVIGVWKDGKHGHVVTVRPNNGPYTGYTGKPFTGRAALGPDDPIINDIGANIGVYPLSQQPSAGFQKGVIFYAAN